MISVVILNWMREAGVRQICASLRNHPLVGEIIVWNNNPAAKIAVEGATTINCSSDLGLYTRFAAASLARHDCVLYHDDDLLVGEGVLDRLYEKWRAQPTVCHSLFGRRPDQAGRYTMHNASGPVEIVLTRFVLAPRTACLHALTKTPAFADLKGIPVGNGEDILLSYATMDLSQQLNESHPGEYQDLGQDDNVSIHMRFAGHVEHRTRVIERCRSVFAVGGVVRRGERQHQWRELKRKVLKRLPGMSPS